MKVAASLIFIGLFVLSCINNHSEKTLDKNIPTEGLFVGYKNGNPVFHSEKDTSLIELENGEFHSLVSIPSSLRVQYVSDKGLVLSKINNQSTTIVIKDWDGSIIKNVEVEDKIDYLTINNNFDTIFYQNQSSNNVSLYIPEKKLYKKDIFKGDFPIYANGNVYFMVEINPSGEGGYDGAILKYYNPTNQYIDSVFNQKTFVHFSISNDANLILTSVEINKNVSECVFNLKTKKIQSITVPDGLGMSFFSYNSDSVFYYSMSNLREIKGYKIY